MSDETSRVPPAKGQLRRPRQGRVLGGVCAAVARSLGVEPVVVRIAAVVLALVSGGAVVLAYLLAWVLIPPETAGSTAPGDQVAAAPDVVSPAHQVDDRTGPAGGHPPGGDGARSAWNAAGSQLRVLASELRPVPTRDPTASRRSPVDTVDTVLTGVGERLRDPTVQESARRTAAQLAAAVNASAEAVNQGARRNAGRADAPADEQTGQEPARTDAAGPDAAGSAQ